MEEIRIDVEHIRPCLQEIHSSAQELIANLNLQIQVYTPQNYLDQIHGTSRTSNVQNQKKYLHFKIKLFLKYKIGCNYS